MGLFSKTYEVTEEHTEIINKYLPVQIQQESYSIENLDYLDQYFKSFIESLNKQKKSKINELKLAQEYKHPLIIKLVNTEVSCEEIFGLVDLGIVERFTSKTTGNSYENGFVQASIETAFEETWAKSNMQYSSVEKAKKLLIEKTLNIFPQSTVIQNFRIDFRELGGSGNVFIYICGTACKSDKFKPINYSEIVANLENNIDKDRDSLKKTKELLSSLPTKKQILKEIKVYEESKDNQA